MASSSTTRLLTTIRRSFCSLRSSAASNLLGRPTLVLSSSSVTTSFRSSCSISVSEPYSSSNFYSCPLHSPFRSFSASASAASPLFARNPSFASLSADDLSYFRKLLGNDGVVTDEDALKVVNIDWMRKYHGHSKLILRPNSTEQVSKILSYCNQRNLAVCPQGGNTGLVGGSIPIYDEIIISLARLNRIINLDRYAGIVTVESGVVLEPLNSYLEENGFIMPLDLGAKGSCQIGGNISTNAGGLRYVRYGSLHGNVLGLEVVLADGRVLDTLSTLRKDNTGYDLKQLFIGAEGTLGIVTKATILCPRRPQSVQVALMGVSSYASVLSTLSKARSSLQEILSAIEFFDADSLRLVLKNISGTRDPLAQKYPFYVLVETQGSDATHDAEKLTRFLENALEEKLIEDGVVAQDGAQQKAIWRLRETITESAAKEGFVYKYDVSLPVSVMYSLVEKSRERLPGLASIGYGHLGDGNLHLNVATKGYDEAVFNKLEPWVFEETAKQKGSISAEHGLGQSKPQYISFSKTDEAVQIMRQIKQMFDPKGILNPYKVLPPKTK